MGKLRRMVGGVLVATMVLAPGSNLTYAKNKVMVQKALPSPVTGDGRGKGGLPNFARTLRTPGQLLQALGRKHLPDGNGKQQPAGSFIHEWETSGKNLKELLGPRFDEFAANIRGKVGKYGALMKGLNVDVEALIDKIAKATSLAALLSVFPMKDAYGSGVQSEVQFLVGTFFILGSVVTVMALASAWWNRRGTSG